MKLSDAEKVGLSAAEIASLEAPDADALLELEQDEPKAADPEPEEAEEVVEAAAEPAEAVEAQEPAAEDASPAPDAQELPKYEVAANNDLQSQLDGLKAERIEVEKKWTGGELTDDERVEALEALQDKRDSIRDEMNKAKMLAELNAQAERQANEKRINAENTAMKALAQAEAAALAAKKPAIDYVNDKVAQSQFDLMFNATKMDPAKAGLTSAQQVAEAHKAVRALRGMVAPVAPKPTPAARVVPQTLSGIPAAGQNVAQDELIGQFNALGSDTRKQEKFMAGLTSAQVDKLVRWADSQVAQH